MAGINEFNVIAGWKEEGHDLIGSCRIVSARGNEIISFEYDKDWLLNNPSLMLDPLLFMTTGKQYIPRLKAHLSGFCPILPRTVGEEN